jgi:WD40 repeat protein
LKEGSDGVTLADSANGSSRGGPGGLTDRTLAFSPDGKFIVSARNTPSERGVFVVTIWDATTGAEVATLPAQPQHIEHTGVISAIAFSPDGSILATGSLDHSIRLWDFAKRERIATLHGHLTEVWALTFSPDGETLATGGKGGEVKLWPTRQQQKADVLGALTGPLAISPDGQTLIASAGTDAIGVFDVTTGELLRRFDLEPQRFFRGPPPGIAVSADTRMVAQALGDGTVKLWDTASGAATSLKASEHSLEVALSPDGGALLTNARDEKLRYWTLSTGASEEWPVKPMRVRFSPDGRTLAVYHWNNPVELWDVATRSVRVTLETQPEFGGRGAFSPDGRLFAMPSEGDTIRLWDVFTGTTIGTFAGHKQPVLSIAFSPDGKTLASSGDDSTVRMWNVTTQQELLVDRRLGGSLTNLLFSPDGRLLLGSKRTAGRGGACKSIEPRSSARRSQPLRPE